MGNDYKKGYLMTAMYYGYDTGGVHHHPEHSPPSLDSYARAKKAMETPPIVKQPDPPKVKEINKQLINSEINKTYQNLGGLYAKLEESSQLMVQEDADDVYDLHKCYELMCKIYTEWKTTTECLKKELEL